MKIKGIISIFLLNYAMLFGSVERSIVPHMDALILSDLTGKVNQAQMEAMSEVIPELENKLRIMSFNMLFNLCEAPLAPENCWINRKVRVPEYIKWSRPDIIGSQELQSDQLDNMLPLIRDEYDVFYGIGIDMVGELPPAIFYRRDRIELVDGSTIRFSDIPEIGVQGSYGDDNNQLVYCHFRDKQTGQEFAVLNTHLSFGGVDKRYVEACKLRNFLLTRENGLPIFITGDFNTFPFRQELDLPFCDGDQVVKTIEEGCVVDGMKVALFGHFGPIASTNFCEKTRQTFASPSGQPGIILDHIFVSEDIAVVAHGIDPATVNHCFPSDHFPVIVDAIVLDRS